MLARIAPFTLEKFVQIVPRDEFVTIPGMTQEMMGQVILDNPGVSGIFEDDQEPFAALGILKLPEYAEAWCQMSQYGEENYARYFAISVYKNLVNYSKLLDYQRIIAHVPIGMTRGHKWEKSLGFVEEEIIDDYCETGVGMVRYVWAGEV
jgi:hypothetical protein